MHKPKTFYALLLSFAIILIFTFYLNTTRVFFKTNDIHSVHSDYNKLIGTKSTENNEKNNNYIENSQNIELDGNGIFEKQRSSNKNGDNEGGKISEGNIENISNTNIVGLKVKIMIQGNVLNISGDDSDNRKNVQDNNVLKGNGIKEDIDNKETDSRTGSSVKPEEEGEIYVDLSEEILENMQTVKKSSKNKEIALDLMVEKILYGHEDVKDNVIFEKNIVNLERSELDKIQVQFETEKRYIENVEDNDNEE